MIRTGMVLKLREEELQARIARTKDSGELAKLEAELRDVRTELAAGGTSILLTTCYSLTTYTYYLRSK